MNMYEFAVCLLAKSSGNAEKGKTQTNSVYHGAVGIMNNQVSFAGLVHSFRLFIHGS